MHIKTSLAVLSAVASIASSHALPAPGIGIQPMHHGKHLKLAKRLEEYEKREFAPYGYDRCGVARKSPYVRRPGASPSASAKWKPCPAQNAEQKAVANPLVPADDDEEDDGSEEAGPTKDDGNKDQAAPVTSPAAAAATDKKNKSADNKKFAAAQAGVWTPPASDTWDRAQFQGGEQTAAPTASSSKKSSSKEDDWSSTQYTTSWVDVTTTSTWTPEEKPSSSSSSSEEPAPSKDAQNDDSGDDGSFKAPPAKVALTGNGGGDDNKWDDGKDNNGGNGDDGKNNDWTPSSSSSSQAPAYTPPSTPSNPGGPKLGLAWDWQNPPGKLWEWSGAQAIYTWSAYPPSDALPDGMVWYPQYWGPGKQGDIEGQIARGVIKPGMTILGYNEPDQAGQANLDVWSAIGSFKNQLTPLASQGYTITSPACTSDDKGFNWIKTFMDNCKDCGISILQTHYYGTNADDFIAYIQKLRQFGLPILISEYASETFGYGADLSLEETQAYVAKTQNWLKQQNDIIAYFYFGPVTPQAANGVNHNSLMITSSGDINNLGRQYLGNA